MFGRNGIVLTASHCELIEGVRLALEVLTGERVRLKEWDSHTEKYAVYIGDTEKKISFCGSCHDILDIALHDEHGARQWYMARFDQPDVVRIIPSNWYMARFDQPDVVRIIPSNDQPDTPTWTVGRSYNDRW